jgi:molybdopterin-guanine dinucleotide biosynthesis protein A
MNDKVAAVLLAGGQARRLGGTDKMLIEVDGRTLLERSIDRIGPQVSALLLNANGDPARFARFGLSVRADTLTGYAGPLAGILTGLEWLREQHPDIPWLVSVATDTPLLPADYVDRLMAAAAEQRADIALARSGDLTHPVLGLWPVRLADDLRRALAIDGIRKVLTWANRYRVAEAAWPIGAWDPFFNINRPEDVANFEALLAQEKTGHHHPISAINATGLPPKVML